VVDVPAEVTDAVATSALTFLTTILTDTLASSGHVGISSTAAGYAATALTSLDATNLLSASSASSLTHAASMEQVLQLLSACMLDGALDGVPSSVSSGSVNMKSYRSVASSLLGGATSVTLGSGSASDAASVSIGASVAELATASGSSSSLVASTLIDTRVTTLDTNPLASALDADGTAAASASRLDQSTTSGGLLLRSLLTLVEVAVEGSATPLSVSGLSASSPVAITLPATTPFPTGPTIVRSKCSVDGSIVSLACPYTADTHTCDFTTNGGGDKYFFDYTCPSVEPKCVWFDPASSSFSGSGCSVMAGYTGGTSVTCECTHLTAFALTGAETAAVTAVVATPAPTQTPTTLPTAQPTRVPTSQPTSAPSPLPSSNPVPVPTSMPTFKPTPLPTTKPTPSPTGEDSVAVSVSFTLEADSAYDAASTDLTFKKKVSKALFGNNQDIQKLQKWTITSTQTSRRLASSSSNSRHHRQLATFDWAASFTVVTSLSAVSATTANDFEAQVNTELSDTAAGGFLNQLKASIPSVTSTAVTPATAFESRTLIPTPLPSPEPSSMPIAAPAPTAAPVVAAPSTPTTTDTTDTAPVVVVDDTKSSGGADSAASSNLIIFLAVGGALLLLCAAGGYKAYQTSNTRKANEFSASSGGAIVDDDAELGTRGNRASSAFEGQNPNPMVFGRDSGHTITSSAPSDLSELESMASGGGGGTARVPTTGLSSQGGSGGKIESAELVDSLCRDASLTVAEKLTRLASAKEYGSFNGNYAQAKRKIMSSKSSVQASSYAELLNANSLVGRSTSSGVIDSEIVSSRIDEEAVQEDILGVIVGEEEEDQDGMGDLLAVADISEPTPANAAAAASQRAAPRMSKRMTAEL
jgi:hypothetical protein